MKKKHPLRRIVLTGATTVSAIVLLLALKPTTAPFASQAGVRAPQRPPVSAEPSAAGGDPTVPVTEPSGPARRTPAGSPAASARPAAPAAPAKRTVTGDVAQTSYGPVQVSITVEGGRITAATAVQAPNGTPMSDQLTASAIPRLNQAAVTAQSAAIDTVSGASFTSQGYQQSLQSALDKAGV
ncbi:FMN-binding protein [Streptomyces sp. NPDC088354]|uniref:FMN-binding protein n=1 Tax=unclassified Streptomyces TaxID=2593676 RepID=UPI0029AEF0CB|nr:FMN-binding protein [Streptomyces sp. MI02-7b]MDX3078062.1 FMN-binding protein [Streptomyces sp. MI02-7b]